MTVSSLPDAVARAGPCDSVGMAMPLVSVVIPAHNAEKFLAETLRSARAQTYPNLEIVVVDDGSTDGTAAIVERHARDDSRIRLIRQANAGVARARNCAIEEARGEFIAPLDADDLWHPDNIAMQVAALQAASPGTGLAYAWSIVIDGSKLIPKGQRPRFEARGEVLPELVINASFIGNGSAAVFTREAITAAGGFDESLRARGGQGCEDWALHIAVAERFDFVVVPHYLIGYRKLPGSMSEDWLQMARSRRIVLEDLQARRPDLPASWFGAAERLVLAVEASHEIKAGRYQQGLEAVRRMWALDKSYTLEYLLKTWPSRLAKRVVKKLLPQGSDRMLDYDGFLRYCRGAAD